MKARLLWIGATLVIIILVMAITIVPFNDHASAQSIQMISGSPGSTISFSGQGPANTDLAIGVTSSILITPGGDQFEDWFNNIHVTSSSDSFIVLANNMKTMTVTGYLAGIHFFGKSYEAQGDASGNGGLSTSGIPPGSYDIQVVGEPLNAVSNVVLSVTATRTVHTGADGSYTASVDTSGLPAGVYSATQNNVEVARVYLGVSLPYSTTINLNAGWNLVSLPITPENGQISYIFSSAQRSNIDVIWDYNGGNWLYWTTEPGYTNQFSTLSPDKGYYIYCYSPMTVTVYGSAPSGPIPQSSLSQGWNFIGFPSQADVTVSSLYGTADVVWKCDNDNWLFWTTEPGYTNQFDTLTPGLAYWVYIN